MNTRSMLAFIAVLGLVALALNMSRDTEAEDPEPREPIEWETIERWSGTGTKTTDRFTIEADRWRVIWSSEPSPGMEIGHLFQLMAEKPNGWIPDVLANAGTERPVSDTSYVHSAGEYYLFINGANGTWEVELQAPKQP